MQLLQYSLNFDPLMEKKELKHYHKNDLFIHSFLETEVSNYWTRHKIKDIRFTFQNKTLGYFSE